MVVRMARTLAFRSVQSSGECAAKYSSLTHSIRSRNMDSGLLAHRLELPLCVDRRRYASGVELAHTRSKLSR